MQLFFLSVLLALVGASAFAADVQLETRERDLSESLFDISALAKDGISRGDLKKAMPDLTIKYDRYVRSGGEQYGILFDAYKSFREADEVWDEKIKTMSSSYDSESKASLVRLYSDRIGQVLNDARTSLDRYAERRRALIAEQATKGKRAKAGSLKAAAPSKSDPAAEVAIREGKQRLEALEARMEALRTESKTKQQELDSQRACRYTNPPSCPK